MKLRATLLTGVSFIGFIMSAPAMAQTILNPQAATGATSQTGGASLSATATGLTALAAGNQFSANAVNQIGTGASAMSVLPTFSFGQQIGAPVDPASLTPPQDTLDQNITNSISASSSSLLLANVTAGLSGGNQTASNAGNSATFGLLANSFGSLQQVVFPSDRLVTGPTTSQSATNSISAIANGGNASILGSGAFQLANNSLNSAAFISAGATSLGLDQKSIGTLDITNGNSAAAQVYAGGNPVVDPLISGLNQSAGFSLNTVSSQGGNALILTNGGSNAGQSLAFTNTAGAPLGTSAINSSNSMLAATGGTNATTTLAALATPGTGTTNITGISQANGLALNQVASSGATTFGDIAQPFAQSIDTTGLAVTGSGSGFVGAATALLGGTGYNDSTNLLVSSTSAGRASITGSGTSATQLNNVAMNSVASTGQVNGYLTQAGTGGLLNSLDNTAIARTTTGAASLASVSQGQNLSLNTMSGAGGTGFTLDQNATDAAFGGNNVQNAVTTTGIATLAGGLQQSTSSVNVATLGALGNGSIQQTAAFSTQSMGNTLTAAGGAAQVGGSQSSVNTVNAIK